MRSDSFFLRRFPSPPRPSQLSFASFNRGTTRPLFAIVLKHHVYPLPAMFQTSSNEESSAAVIVFTFVSDNVLYHSLLGLASPQEVWGHLSAMATIRSSGLPPRNAPIGIPAFLDPSALIVTNSGLSSAKQHGLPRPWQRTVHQQSGPFPSHSDSDNRFLVCANQLFPFRYSSNHATVRRIESIWFSRFSKPWPSFA
jgi:hypothetical protein